MKCCEFMTMTVPKHVEGVREFFLHDGRRVGVVQLDDREQWQETTIEVLRENGYRPMSAWKVKSINDNYLLGECLAGKMFWLAERGTYVKISRLRVGEYGVDRKRSYGLPPRTINVAVGIRDPKTIDVQGGTVSLRASLRRS